VAGGVQPPANAGLRRMTPNRHAQKSRRDSQRDPRRAVAAPERSGVPVAGDDGREIDAAHRVGLGAGATWVAPEGGMDARSSDRQGAVECGPERCAPQKGLLRNGRNCRDGILN